MDQTFACPECGTPVEVHGLAPGRQVRCGFCQRLIEVPYIRRVESPAWKRRRFGSPRWVTWAWAGIGVLATLIVIAAAVRLLRNKQCEAEARSIHELVAASRNHEEKGELGQALVELDTAIELAAQSATIGSDERSRLKETRQGLARREAQAIVHRLEATAAADPFPLSGWLEVLARTSTDPDLQTVKASATESFGRKIVAYLELELKKARGLFESGKPVAAFETCDAATGLLGHAPAASRPSLRAEMERLVTQIIERHGIVIDPIRGHLLAGSLAKYNATMIPELHRGLKAKDYVPLEEGSSWRDRWSAAPYRLTVDLNEKLEGNYMSTDNRLTRIDAHLVLSFKGREVWQTTPTARTTVPLPNLPAYQSARAALKHERSEELEQLLYENARGQIHDKFAFALKNLPGCGEGLAASNP